MPLDSQLIEKIKNNTPAIVALNFYTHPLVEEEVVKLTDALNSNHTVTSVNLSGHSLSILSVQTLANMLKENDTLAMLDLTGNNLGGDKLALLAAGLRTNQRLTSLDISNNPLQSKGMELVASAIIQHQMLQSLNLSRTQLGIAGAEIIAQQFYGHKTLTNLDLSNNQFKDSGIQALAFMLKDNKVLLSLNLRANQFTAVGLQALSEALANNHTLIELKIELNRFGNSGEHKTIENYLARNLNLKNALSKPALSGISHMPLLNTVSFFATNSNVSLPAQTPNISTIKKVHKPILDTIPHIARNQLTLNAKLGQGGFGYVCRGTWQHNDVAIKMLLTDMLSEDALEEFEHESSLMNRLHHPNIVRLYGINCEEKPYYMVMELMHNGSLRSYIWHKKPLTATLKQQISLDITRGLAFLHQKKIIHRDLKTDNVLLDERLRAKLTDFGLSKIKETTQASMTAEVGTHGGWMAPELFEYSVEGKVNHSAKSDMFAYGVTLWALWTQSIKPFKSASRPNIADQWVIQGIREIISTDSTDCTPLIHQLITTCWTQNPDERFTAEQALQHLMAEPPQEISAPRLN